MRNRDRIAEIIGREFVNKKILIIGDLMVDEYIVGKVQRISPEAPVPVLNFKEKTLEAGGASNVANNMRCLGSEVYVSGLATEDDAGKWLRRYLSDNGMHTEGILGEHNRPTIVKTRFATKGQQLLRVDNEVSTEMAEETQAQIIAYVNGIIGQIDAVVLSDYKKGVLDNTEFVKKIIKLCNDNHVLVSIDSKSRNISAFENADFVKPNNLELEEAVGIKIVDEESLNCAGKKYLEKSGAKCLVVTRGASGISVFEPDKNRRDFASKEVQVYDVTGAGDTVISTITLGLVSGLSMEESVELANVAAGIVISKVGTSPVTREELLRCVYEE